MTPQFHVAVADQGLVKDLERQLSEAKAEVERLREAIRSSVLPLQQERKIASDLRADVERLKRRAERAETTEAIWLAEANVLKIEVERLKEKLALEDTEWMHTAHKLAAEVERLKGALERIANYKHGDTSTMIIARDALEAKP